MAALFDALMFLTAVSVVAVSTILLCASPEERVDVKLQDYVDRSHLVLCRTTLQVPLEEGDRDQNGMDAPSLSIGSLMVDLLSGDGNDDLPPWLRAEVQSILDGLLRPRYNYTWSVSVGSSEITISAWNVTRLADEQTYVSHLELGGVPMLEATLTVWLSG